MLILGGLAIALASWFFCIAAPRSSSALRGVKATMAGLCLLLAGTLAVTRAGFGLAEAISAALSLLMVTLPCASWMIAARRTR